MKKFGIKPEIYFSEGSMAFLKKIHSSGVFILADPIIDQLGYLQEAVTYLQSAGIPCDTCTEVKPEPDVNAVMKVLKKYTEHNATTVIAFGGGSAMDTVKAMLYFLHQASVIEGKKFHQPLFIAIPTTSGTGSEVTDFSVIAINGKKTALIDNMMLPDVAILDSACTKKLPPHIIADTGLDALVHAIEAYVSKEANDYTDALAEKSVQIIFSNLFSFFKNAEDTTARERIQCASCMAGMAFTNAGLGITHSMAHAFGGTFHLSHGRSNALLMDTVIEYNADIRGKSDIYAVAKYASLAKVIGLPARTVREGYVNFLQAIHHLKSDLEIPEGICAAGIDESAFIHAAESMAEQALKDRCTPTNPRTPTKEDIVAMYRSII